MKKMLVVFRRELAAYFATPVAYVFLIIFLILSGVLTWSRMFGDFYETDHASLEAFFGFHSILYLTLIPAISMRMWAEERRSGTIELLLTLPLSMSQVVIGKFLAAWTFIAIALALTCTEWITVSYLGDPDHGVIFAAYLGSLLMAGGFLAIGTCISALTKNQVIAFVLSLIACLFFVLSGLPAVLDFIPSFVPDFTVDAVRSFSFHTHFTAITQGKVELRDFVFFTSVIALFLYANTVIVDLEKAN